MGDDFTVCFSCIKRMQFWLSYFVFVWLFSLYILITLYFIEYSYDFIGCVVVYDCINAQ